MLSYLRRTLAYLCLVAALPATESDVPLRRIAFGSCADQNKAQPI